MYVYACTVIGLFIECEHYMYSCDGTHTLTHTPMHSHPHTLTHTHPCTLTHTVIPPSGGLTQQQTVGVGVGVGIAGAVILILVIVAIIVLVLYMKRRKADKYVLNYSTVYGKCMHAHACMQVLQPLMNTRYI